jgi:hypothetical protein
VDHRQQRQRPPQQPQTERPEHGAGGQQTRRQRRRQPGQDQRPGPAAEPGRDEAGDHHHAGVGGGRDHPQRPEVLARDRGEPPGQERDERRPVDVARRGAPPGGQVDQLVAMEAEPAGEHGVDHQHAGGQPEHGHQVPPAGEPRRLDGQRHRTR